MKICVWRSGHDIADRVAEAVWDGIPNAMQSDTRSLENNMWISMCDIHIGYGILRGMADVFRECDRQGKPWFCIDRGYWKPGHYDGYYRVSLRGTQQTSGWPEPDWERWKKLGLAVEPQQGDDPDGLVMICPPTDYAAKHFGVDDVNWWIHEQAERVMRWNRQVFVRTKACEIPLAEHLKGVRKVITFNSSVGWEALRRGIPVESDPVHSIVGAWQAKHGADKREEMFATMAGLQLTLDEMRGGMLMPLLQKLLDASPATKA